MYKSDLGQVVTVDYSKGVAEVRLVPRIDYAELAKRALEGRMPAFGGHRAGAARPKPKCDSFTWPLLEAHTSARTCLLSSCCFVWHSFAVADIRLSITVLFAARIWSHAGRLMVVCSA